MYVRDPSALRRPASRIDAMVRIFNVWFSLFLLYALLILLMNIMPVEIRRPFLPLLEAYVWLVFVLAAIAWPAWFAIRLGLVKCPCCGLRFSHAVFSFSLSKECDNCGFNVRTVSRRNDF